MNLSIRQVEENGAILIGTQRAAQYLQEHHALARLSLQEEPVMVWNRMSYLHSHSISTMAKALIRFVREQFRGDAVSIE